MFKEALKTIRKVAETASSNEKVAILKQNDSACLRDLCLYTYDRYRTYRLYDVVMPKSFAHETPEEVWPDFIRLLNTMASHSLGSIEGKQRVEALLSRCATQDAWVLANVINRDLRAGIDEQTINKAFPQLIPVFNIQLASPLNSWDRIIFPVVVEEKIDGIRCVVLYDGERSRFFSRRGFEFETGMDPFAEEVGWLIPGIPHMFDGEIRAFRFNEGDANCRKHRNGNWQFEYTKGLCNRKFINPLEVKDYFKLYIWDAVDLEYFMSQGKWGAKLPLEDRKAELCSMFHRHSLEFKNIEMIPNFIMESREEVQAYMQELKKEKKEGCMLKAFGKLYGFGRNHNILKLKHFVEGDFRILDAYEGEKKYKGILGGFVVGTDDGQVVSKMGTGISDDDRADLWVEYLAGRLVGQIVELQLKDVTAGGSLQLPSLLRFRQDKDTTDTWESLMEKLAGQKEEE